ncbi:hypothetical protein DFP73DRAFT_588805 [Morchella snyderi]|nr:hypothetical protein DFP73DRAFT_588805 [Morchella snyderi]
MTLGTDTIALLRHGVDALLHLTGPVPYGRLSPDERRSALMQLMVTAETAARIAEVGWAPPNQLGGDAEYISAETERLKAEAGKVEKETKRAAWETERLKAEADKVRAETEKVVKEMEKVVKQIELTARETFRLKVEGEKVEKEAVRAVKDTEKIKAEARKVGKEVERLVAGRDRMEAEQAKVAKEKEAEQAKVAKEKEAKEKEVDRRVRELRNAEWEIEKLEKETLGSMQETTRLRVELDQVRHAQSTNDSEFPKLRGELEIKMSEKRDMDASGLYFLFFKKEIEGEIEEIEERLERLSAERETMKREEHRVRANLEGSVVQTNSLRKELDRLRSAIVL